MVEQLVLFPVPDTNSDKVSGTDKTPYLETYKPNGRKTEYFRVVWRVGKTCKHKHIRGGNVNSKLARYRAGRVQLAISRGAPIEEIVAMLTDWR